MRAGLSLIPVAMLGACKSSDAPPPSVACEDPPRGPDVARFADVTHDSGVDFVYATPTFKGGGLASADLDGDGLPEIVASRRTGGIALFHNTGAMHFEPVATSGVDATLAVHAIAAADLDNDGDVDLVLAGPNIAYVMANAGDGAFTEVARFADSGMTEQVLPVDLDGDGLLDLYFSNYDVVTPANSTDLVYGNRGDFTFAPPRPQARSMTWTTTAFDADGDGDQDLYVANDTLLGDFGRPVAMPPASTGLPPDQFLRNDSQYRFTDIAETLGLTEPRSSMGGVLGDFDDDGQLDIYVPNLGAKKLFVHDGGGYVERAAAFGLAAPLRSNDRCGADSEDPDCLLMSWSAALSDFDVDGVDELLVVNGVTSFAGSLPPVVLFERASDASFHEVAPGISCVDARGLVVTDLDGDGDQDVAIGPNNGPLQIYRNRSAPAADSWLRVQLRGEASNREGIGAVATVHMASGRHQIRVIGSGGVINSASPAEAVFGLGSDSVVDIVVQWPSGRRSLIRGPASGELLVHEPPLVKSQ